MAEKSVEYLLGEMNSKLDALGRRLDDALSQGREERRDHEKRIRSLERWKWGVIGASTVLATIISLAAKYL